MPGAGEGGASGAGSGEVDDVSIDLGNRHACATRAGALYCWGNGERGKLGVGDTSERLRPARVGRDSDWLSVTTGLQHSCALRKSGKVFCFGANDVGQLGVPNVPESDTPLELKLPAKALSIVTETNTSCALLEDGRLYCWGENTEGQLGLSDRYPGDDYFEPIEVGSLGASTGLYRAVDVGHGHVCGVRDSGLLYCWGRNTARQLGLGPDAAEQIRKPTQVGSQNNWRLVQAGADSSCAIDATGALYCWGTNEFGNLGTGQRDTYSLPTRIGPELTFRDISIDTFHSCAIDAERALYCWGRGIEGQLSTGDWDDREVPTLVPGAAWRGVRVGRFFTCAVRVDGAVLCSGSNESGQLGQGDTERRSVLSLVTFE